MHCDLLSRGIKRKFDDEEGNDDRGLDCRSDAVHNRYVPPPAVPPLADGRQTLLQQRLLSGSGGQPTDRSSAADVRGTIFHPAGREANHGAVTTPPPPHQTVTSAATGLGGLRLRQVIFNISMCKLSKYRQTPDPSLFRSVIICNTLKRLEKEMEREGIKINFGPNGVSLIPSVIGAQNLTLDPPPNAACHVPMGASCISVENGYYNFAAEAIVPEKAAAADVTASYGNDESTDRHILDLDSSSGKVTPFHRSRNVDAFASPSSSSSSSSNSSSSAAAFSSSASSSAASPASHRNDCNFEWDEDSIEPSSALLTDDETNDILTTLNWSSVLNFSSLSTDDSDISKVSGSVCVCEYISSV